MQFEKAKEFILDKLAKELPAHLSYHGLNHITDVYTAAELIAAGEGITGEDLLLLLTAVLFHDSGFTQQQKDHEELSCQIARLHLPGYGYNEAQLEKIYGMIRATKIPQTPHNLLEQIICDADLDYLGREDFFTIGDRLFAELMVYGIITTQEAWNKLQITFLDNHRYFTATSIGLRNAKKQEYLHMLKEKVSNG